MKNMLNLLLSIILVSCCTTPAFADDTYLYTGAWSKHIGGNATNETHSFIGFESNKYLVGWFKNSYDDPTISVDYKVLNYDKGYWNAGAYLGVTYGYKECYGGNGDARKVCPIVIPAISYTKYKLQPTFLLLGNAMVFSLRWSLQ